MSAFPIPAATLVLFREETKGPAQHLFVERAATMRFAAGALVFPGGRVDEGDRWLAHGFPDLDHDDAAARVAAVRETIEEAGVAVGLSPAPDLHEVGRLRHGLEAGQVFGDLLAAGGFTLNLDALTLFARWCPNFHETRNFDTRFYLARMPVNAPAASVDATENVTLAWSTAQAVLDAADEGTAQIIFPTRRNLERLAMLGTFEAARMQATQIQADLITPWIEDRDGVPHLRIPDDRGYPVCSEPFLDIRRG